MVLPRATAFRTLLRSPVGRTSRRASGIRQWGQTGRRGYASGGQEAKKSSSDLPWLIGSVAITVPSTYWLLQQGPAGKAHSHDNHGEKHGGDHGETPKAEGESEEASEGEPDSSNGESKNTTPDTSDDETEAVKTSGEGDADGVAEKNVVSLEEDEAGNKATAYRLIQRERKDWEQSSVPKLRGSHLSVNLCSTKMGDLAFGTPLIAYSKGRFGPAERVGRAKRNVSKYTARKSTLSELSISPSPLSASNTKQFAYPRGLQTKQFLTKSSAPNIPHPTKRVLSVISTITIPKLFSNPDSALPVLVCRWVQHGVSPSDKNERVQSLSHQHSSELPQVVEDPRKSVPPHSPGPLPAKNHRESLSPIVTNLNTISSLDAACPPAHLNPARDSAQRTFSPPPSNFSPIYDPYSPTGPNGPPPAAHRPGQVAHPNMALENDAWGHSLCECGDDEREVRDREDERRRQSGPASAIESYMAPGGMHYAPPPGR
ncbi:hypothetical protein FGG08_001500 [Glutinoglossum americanum]|uniref:Uncharacterized protein n=1 Tax=Glutinoglossum americanum TaxID=1670608 RepID=A0A9P8I6W1_9PEZI|nr:hypothetical protein FGG08_001500 [Glutinoglossum americanum]